MRAALAALATLLVSLPAAAGPTAGLKPTVVWKQRVIPAAPQPHQLTNVSRKLFLNDCRPTGCTVAPGNDNSLTNRSSIPESQVTLSPYGHGDAHWQQLVACVRETFAPFDVEVVTTDPGPSTAHFEVMIGGTSQQLHPQLEAGGVAPFISCGAQRNNVISFVFAETTGDLNYLCGAVAQEACHVWGLDHEMDAADPMTYLQLGSRKRFQNNDADCGEFEPRGCDCGGSTQNSFRYMTNTFGLAANLEPARLSITAPADGQWVKAGFPIRGQLDSPLGQLDATLSIDGTEVASIGRDILAFNAPASLKSGAHTIQLDATDQGDRAVSATVSVRVMAACGDGAGCDKGFLCLGGSCLPNADVAGGLGAACTSNGECVTGACGDDGAQQLCTSACDAGATCPSGFDCLSPSNVCWPSEGGGGCATGGGGAAGFALVGAAAIALGLRRRRRPCCE